MNENALTLEGVRAAFHDNIPRYTHIAGVVGLAENIEKNYGKFDGKLIRAAIYHDIGYAEPYRVTNFHSVDGALAARKHGIGEDIAEAVLYHTGSWIDMRLLRLDLKDYYDAECRMMKTPLNRAVSFCDLHTGPLGQRFSLDERLADIVNRYGPKSNILEAFKVYDKRFHEIDSEWSPYLDPLQGSSNG
ncbi:MAG: HD domain-containing protein [Alphaproteobacteria bacterium]|nr:HD domain-containing protein [Alphaproteobacteria bacterium]